MSEPWQPDDSQFWQTQASESSHPSFPFADREGDSLWQSLPISQPGPPPPPPYTLDNDSTTKPIIHTTFGIGIGLIIGIVITFGIVSIGLGYLIFSGRLGIGNHANVTNTSSLAAGGGTTNTAGGTSGPGNGQQGNQGGAGPSGTGATATSGTTVTPGTTPINTATPGASMTATAIAATATVMPTATAIPPPLPLTASAQTQDHKSITVNVQTKPGAALNITITFCDSSTTQFNGTADVGLYSHTVTGGIPKCPGDPPDTVMVTAHLAGYSDATVTVTSTQIG